MHGNNAIAIGFYVALGHMPLQQLRDRLKTVWYELICSHEMLPLKACLLEQQWTTDPDTLSD